MVGANERVGWLGASMLLLACLEPNPNAVDTSTSDDTTTQATGDTGTTDTDTGPLTCAQIVDLDECGATQGCQPVNGSRLDEHGPNTPCLEPSEFLGCIDAQACDDALTWFCQGNGSYQVPDSCGPEGFTACAGPADPVDACP